MASLGRVIRSGIKFDTARDLSNSEQDKEIEKQNATCCHEFKLFRSDLTLSIYVFQARGKVSKNGIAVPA